MGLTAFPRVRPVVLLLFVALAAAACLMPVHNDTWWHLRAGREMWESHRLLFVDTFSYTAAGQFFWNHSWLAQVLFYPLFAVGGLPLLTACCAVVVVTAWALVWRMTRGPLDLRLLLMVLALSASTTIWSVRPQVFSILGLPLIALLVARDRWAWATAIMIVWANLHAGMAIGVVVAGASVIAAVVADRDRIAVRLAGAFGVAVATLLTPLGFRNWTEMLASMARSRANQIQEWQPTPLPPGELLFWGFAVVLLWQALRRWRTLESHEDRVIVAAAVLILPLAARTFRNVPAFMMLAVPAFTRLTWPAGERPETPAPRWSPLLRALVGVTAAAGAVVVATAWATPWPMLQWRPLAPDAARAIAACRPPLYNRYFDGGPIIWFVPTQPVFVDSRQDPFPVALVEEATRVEDTGDYEALFATWHINCAALPPGSPTVSALKQHDWVTRYQGPRWMVLERPPR